MKLRAVFSVDQEPFTVVARADSGIKTFKDLKGKRVNIGNPGSGQRGTMEIVMDKMGWAMGDLALTSELKSSEQAAALCDNKIDAIVFTAGHPNGSIQEATTSCDAVIVTVDNDVIRKLVADNAYCAMATVPGGMYKGTDSPVTTFGVGATFVSSSKTDTETIYQITMAVSDNIKRFRQMHPAFASWEPSSMIVNNLSAPLHDGAVKYYEGKGMLK
jgi:TRAP transporter TAXI family solute receptor